MQEKNFTSSVNRSQVNLKRLIFANSWAFFRADGRRIPPFFLTLTFADNITDISSANRLFSKFIQRFNYELFHVKKNKLVYVGVPQFQERGALHYHVCLFNMPFHKGRENNIYATIRRVWKYGTFINLKKIDTTWGIYNYIKRYMLKNFEDGRLYGRRKFFFSLSCKRSVLIRNNLLIEMLLPYIEANAKTKKIFVFDIPFSGSAFKTVFILPDLLLLSDIPAVADILSRFVGFF